MGPWLHLLFCRLGPMAWNNCMKYLCQRLSGGQILFSSVQLSHSVVSDSLRPPWITARQASLSITNSRNLFKLIPLSRWRYPAISSSVVPFSSCPQPLPASGSFPVSQLFVSTLHMRWPKYWSFSFSISPSNEHPGLISFRMDWLDLLAVQGTLKIMTTLNNDHEGKKDIPIPGISQDESLPFPW